MKSEGQTLSVPLAAVPCRVSATPARMMAIPATTGKVMVPELDDQKTRVVRRTTTPLRNIKADRPWTVPSVS
jgi:hypothetical protein